MQWKVKRENSIVSPTPRPPKDGRTAILEEHSTGGEFFLPGSTHTYLWTGRSQFMSTEEIT